MAKITLSEAYFSQLLEKTLNEKKNVTNTKIRMTKVRKTSKSKIDAGKDDSKLSKWWKQGANIATDVDTDQDFEGSGSPLGEAKMSDYAWYYKGKAKQKIKSAGKKIASAIKKHPKKAVVAGAIGATGIAAYLKKHKKKKENKDKK